MKSSVSIPGEYKNITYNGVHYYCIMRNSCEIVVIDNCFNIEQVYITKRRYDYICFDKYENCFWASSKCNKLFKLDCKMNEIDYIIIPNLTDYITGISCSGCKKITLCFAGEIIEINTQTKEIITKYSKCFAKFFGVLCIENVVFVIVFKSNKYYIEVLNLNYEKIDCFEIEDDFLPINLMLKCFKENIAVLQVFSLKNKCYPYLLNYCAKKYVTCNFYNCNSECCENKCCDNDCNGEIDIIKSIAEIESALAEILKAEARKIHEVISKTDDIDAILCVNKSINKTIANITHLEQVLYDKLSAVCDDCNKTC